MLEGVAELEGCESLTNKVRQLLEADGLLGGHFQRTTPTFTGLGIMRVSPPTSPSRDMLPLKLFGHGGWSAGADPAAAPRAVASRENES